MAEQKQYAIKTGTVLVSVLDSEERAITLAKRLHVIRGRPFGVTVATAADIAEFHILNGRNPDGSEKKPGEPPAADLEKRFLLEALEHQCDHFDGQGELDVARLVRWYTDWRHRLRCRIPLSDLQPK